MRSMRGIFDDLVTSALPKSFPIKLVHWLARLCLRRLYTDEETEEIRGISLATDIDLYLLICLNTVLDLLMGCTSGGVRTKSGRRETITTKMLHFRTLDWAIDPLRGLIIQLEFFRDSNPHEVLATSVTYVGYVGVLTGVRKDLSVSLNFRPVHNPAHDLAFYHNHLLVLVGVRPYVSPLLRQCILSPFSPATRSSKTSDLSTLESIILNMPSIPTTAAYFIFSDGTRTVTMEKDHRTAVVRSSSSFIITTNHDQKPDSEQSEQSSTVDKRSRHHLGLSLMSSEAQALSDLLEESTERYDCIQAKWDYKLQKHVQINMELEQNAVQNKVSSEAQTTRSSLRLRQRREKERLKHQSQLEASQFISSDCDDMAITQTELLSWLTAYPILNESTHYAAIMDPFEGKVVWIKRYDSDELDII